MSKKSKFFLLLDTKLRSAMGLKASLGGRGFRRASAGRYSVRYFLKSGFVRLLSSHPQRLKTRYPTNPASNIFWQTRFTYFVAGLFFCRMITE